MVIFFWQLVSVELTLLELSDYCIEWSGSRPMQMLDAAMEFPNCLREFR